MKAHRFIIHKINLSKLLTTIIVVHIWLYVCVYNISHKYTRKHLLFYTPLPRITPRYIVVPEYNVKHLWITIN